MECELRQEAGAARRQLESTLAGCRAESEMHEEAVLRVAVQDRSISQLSRRVTDLQQENNHLRDQLSAALEHTTTKVSGINTHLCIDQIEFTLSQ